MSFVNRLGDTRKKSNQDVTLWKLSASQSALFSAIAKRVICGLTPREVGEKSREKVKGERLK